MKIHCSVLSRHWLAGIAAGWLLLAAVASAQFVDVSSQVGLSDERKKSWGNPVWGDFNNDGFLDLMVPTHGLSVSHGPFVYLNNGGTSFTDIRSTSNIKKGLTFDSTDWHGYAFGDYDGDGNIDVYVSEGAKGNVGGTDKRDQLFHSNGDGTFTNASASAGLLVNRHRGRCALWFDFDNDGKLDLFAKNYGDANDLYKNNGNGTFTPVPDAAGLAYATSGIDFGSIMAMADYDNDGFMDIAFTGDGNAMALYRHMSDGNYVDATSASGLSYSRDCKGMAWGDYNNDGLVDLYIAHGQTRKASTAGTLYRNNGNGTFTNATIVAGLPTSGNFWSPLWGDYDNDGYLDLFVTSPGTTGNGINNANRLYHNNGNGTFSDVGAAQGVALQDNVALHKTAAWGDFNNDGFLDLVVKNGIGAETSNGPEASGTHVLLRNTPNTNHFIKINLQGVQSNFHGIGARLTLTTPTGLTCFRQATGDGGGNHSSQSSEPVHFGIGAASTATVTIAWPSGSVGTLADIPANSTITVVEGGLPTPTPTPAAPVITKQPSNRRVKVGDSAKFVVEAAGDSLLYKWQKNGAEILEATAATYLTPPATLADDGSIFAVVVSNPGGSVTSRDVQLGVSAAGASASVAPSP